MSTPAGDGDRYALLAADGESVLAGVHVPRGSTGASVTGNGGGDPFADHGMAIEILATLIDADLSPSRWVPGAAETQP